MAKLKQLTLDPKQRTITNFFQKHKGPLKFDSKSIIMTSAENEMLSKKYRRRNRKRIISINDKEVCDQDVEYIKTENFVTDNIGVESDGKPLSPNIIFRTDIGYTKYLSTDKNKSIEDCWESKVYGKSPPKIQKTESTIVGELAVTKSELQVEQNQRKVSRTLKMTQLDNLSDVNVASTFNEEKNEKLKVEHIDIGDLLEVELLDDNDSLNKIMKHIQLITEIVENATETRLSTLLLDYEKNILKIFQTSTVYQKYFTCKLFTHRIKWYNAYKFAQNIKLPITRLEIKEIVNSLKEKMIIVVDYSSEEIVSLLNYLSVDDVKEIHDALRLKIKQKNKPKLIDNILKYINNQTTLHPTVSLDKRVRQMVSNKLGEMVQISPAFYTAFYKVHLLYTFTNPEFDIPSGLYLRINNIKYGNVVQPDFRCEDEIVFENAQDFAEFYKAFSYRAEVIQTVDQKKGDIKFTTLFDLSKEVIKEFTNVLTNVNDNVMKDKPRHLMRFTAGHQYASALWILCQHLGSKYPQEVRNWLEVLLGQTHFYQRKRGLWYSQLSLVYSAHLKEKDKAIETLLYGLRDEKVSTVDMSEIVYRARSYCKKKKLHTEELLTQLSLWESIPHGETFPSIVIKALGNDSSETTRQGDYKYMNANGDISYMNVEEIANRHYEDNEDFTKCVHCEGALMQTIFYILFWNIIFTDGIPHTFICKMQYLPLDFYSEEFYANRKTEIDRRLADLKFNWSMEYLKSYIIETWNSVSDFNLLIRPGLVKDGEELYNVINCIGRTVVSEICRRLVQNFRDYRAGMPDLFVCNGSKCKFVEVKGPGDKLSAKQKLWIHFLLTIGANAEVCYVSKIGGKRGK